MFKLHSLVLASAMVVSTLSFAQGNLDEYPNEVHVDDHKGQTYLSFMRKVIKPALDKIATEGYEMCGSDAVMEAYEMVDKKVQYQAKKAAKSLENMQRIADELEGTIVTLNDLPRKIAKVDRKVNRYKLATFFGLACGGGVSIRYDHQNYGLNIHYDAKEERSGRSFGVGPTRKANDASDKNYLNDLQSYLEEYPVSSASFYDNLFNVLLNTDASEYPEISEEGQTVLTDFLSVFTAEQDRNLMDGVVKPHWDAALLEVTLLAHFHGGQDEIALYYYNPATKERSFTTETLKQKPCATPSRSKEAQLNDYWQFSKRIDNKEHCRRSGINITKREFRRLGEKLTKYVSDNYPESYEKVIKSIGLRRTKNVYYSLSKYLISDKLPSKLSASKVKRIKSAFMEFLEITREDAMLVTDSLTK